MLNAQQYSYIFSKRFNYLTVVLFMGRMPSSNMHDVSTKDLMSPLLLFEWKNPVTADRVG